MGECFYLVLSFPLRAIWHQIGNANTMHRFPVVCGIDNSSVEDRENEAIGHDGEREKNRRGEEGRRKAEGK